MNIQEITTLLESRNPPLKNATGVVWPFIKKRVLSALKGNRTWEWRTSATTYTISLADDVITKDIRLQVGTNIECSIRMSVGGLRKYYDIGIVYDYSIPGTLKTRNNINNAIFAFLEHYVSRKSIKELVNKKIGPYEDDEFIPNPVSTIWLKFYVNDENDFKNKQSRVSQEFNDLYDVLKQIEREYRDTGFYCGDISNLNVKRKLTKDGSRMVFHLTDLSKSIKKHAVKLDHILYDKLEQFNLIDWSIRDEKYSCTIVLVFDVSKI